MTDKRHRTGICPGARCVVNGNVDLYMNSDARPFIGSVCFVVKQTKSGTVQVALADDPKMVLSVPVRNLDFMND